jgi:arginine/lysine/ornithine decarboxylase
MDRHTPIMDALGSLSGSAKARFCTPGHKGDTGFFGGGMLSLDITELPGADNLLAPRGAIAASQDLHAQYIDAAAVHYTTGGSTAGVLAMLSLFRGRKVIFPRGIHLSAANAVFMFGITPVYLDLAPCDYPAVVTPEQVHTALRTHKDAAAVFIVYPNYFGLCCDIEGIAEIVHKAGLPLVVDAAHAAHFVYSSLLPLAPSYTGADVWTESTHKTLPAMNQCACVGVAKDARINPDELKYALTTVQTTSPSYPLLASIDYAHAYMRDKGEQELYRIISLGKRFEEMLGDIGGMHCPDIRADGLADRDPLKIVIDVSATGHTGMAVKALLAAKGIHIEAADMRNILLLLSVGDTAAQLEILHETLRRIEKIRGRGLFFSPYSMPAATKYAPGARHWRSIEKIRIERATGCVCACTAGVYPPAEAVVARGQVISFEMSGYLLEARRQGFDMFGVDDEYIWVYKERQ